MEFIKLVFIGIVLGIANVIPGVSGGTMAVVFNIYDKLINLITLNIKKIISQWKFILPLCIGMLCGVVLFSKLITILFEKYHIQTNWFFIGIILGSIPMITKRFIFASKNKTATKIAGIICAIIAFVVMVITTYANPNTTEAVAQNIFTFRLAIKLFICLALAAVAMIIPGISGSFLMLALGIYSTIIKAIADFNIPLLIPSALGAIVGLLGGASIVRLLMNKVPSQTYGTILGLVLGSILVIFPGFGNVITCITSLICAILGFAISYLFSREKR